MALEDMTLMLLFNDRSYGRHVWHQGFSGDAAFYTVLSLFFLIMAIHLCKTYHNKQWKT
ncbi:hypothetical protein [Holospora curviuscula]|uniref:hypothetical protein n=1 Tax=Holospora curviuscula TaxID=1082868 RepID=UPI001A9C6EAB|nr:hypothetical protein [Holospora curviuscula]